MERRGPMAAQYSHFDIVTQEIVEALKKLEEDLVSKIQKNLTQVRHPARKKKEK